MSFDFNTLVTNRTQQDVAYAKHLAEKLVTGTATEAEKAEWNSFALKGVYNHTDLNRVTVAMDILKAKMESYGYIVPNYKKIELPYPSTGVQSRLPAGYLELSYIESTGTQYIDTGFMHNQDTRTVMDVQATSMTTNAWAFGGRITNANAKHDVFYYNTNSTWTSDYHSSRKYPEGISATARVLIDFDKNVCTINGVTVTHVATTFQSTANLMLLALNTAGTISGQMSAKLYSCQIYDNGTLIRDFVPCISPSGEVGLFDLVNQQFYGNAGTGVFVSGERVNVVLPSGYTRLTYIESTGTQYIDTGFKPNNNTRVVLSAYNASTSSGWTYGAWDSSSSNQFAFSCLSTYSFRYGSGGVQLTTLPVGDFEVDQNKNAYNLNGTSGTITAQTFSCSHTMYLFAINANGAVSSGKFTGRIKKCQIYDNGILVRDFVPCKNNVGVVGLYDIVNKTFYQNSGSGSFLTGSTYRDLPYGYTQVEYLEATGSQYINTKFKPNQDTRVVVDADFPKNGSTATWFFGAEVWETSARYQLRITSSGTTYVSDYGSQALTTEAVPSGRTIVDKNKNVCTISGVSYTNNEATFQCSYNLRLFGGSNTSGTSVSSPSTLYSCQIYDNDTLVRDYVPCINSAGTAGLYDMANDVFYQNAGTGTFTVGNSLASSTQSSGGSSSNSGTVTLKNLVADGSFETTNTWSVWSTDALVTEQAHFGATSLKLTGDQLAQVPVELPILNHVYYAREYIKTDGEVTISDGRFEVHGGDGVGLNWVYGWNRGNYPGWTIQSGVHKIEAVNASSYVLRTFKVGGSGTAYVDGVMLIDLTEAFGSGLEPDKAWCDNNIPFFDGSKVLTLPPRYNWQEYDIPTVHQLTVYLANVTIIRSVLAVMETTPNVPVSMLNFMLQEANDIEQILLDVSRQLSTMATTFIPCGEALCGGDNL